MRTIPFREVLYDIARKNSIDPESDNFLEKEAIAMGTFIDQWVRRTYPGADWPEWTQIHEFAPSNHVVSWDSVALDLVIPPSFTGTLVEIGRVFTVYLVDPRITSYPVSTNHTLLDTGIHCGYEHGSSVWIKFMPPAPRFNAQRWQPDETYQKDDVRYSSTTGECYRSKVSGNQGHDPAVTFSHSPSSGVEQEPIKLDTEIVVPLTPFNPGLPETSKIVRVSLTALVPGPDPDNPPPALSQYEIHVENPLGTSVALALTNPNGTDTLDVITSALANQLIGTLGAGWTITPDTNVFSIDIEHASDFYVPYAWFTPPFPPGSPISKLKVSQIRAYTPSMGKTDGVKQVIRFPLSPDQVTPGAIYTLSFKDTAGADHSVSYTAVESDGSTQVLSQLINAINTTSDDFFRDVASALDADSPASLHGTPTAVSLNAAMMLPGSPWWEVVFMPIDLADQIMRGTTADVLKEWGQMQTGAAEEQVVPAESQASSSKFATNQVPGLTTQQEKKGRYVTGG